jgi:integrase
MRVEELYQKVYDAYWSQLRFDRSGWNTNVAQLYRAYIHPTLGKKAALLLKPSHIRQWHRELDATPTAANRALEVLSRMYSYACEYGWIPEGTNPASPVRSHRERQRARFASPDEMKAFEKVFKKYEAQNPREVAFFRLLMLTGARPKSLMRIERNELAQAHSMAYLSFEGKAFEKTGQKDTIIIPHQAMEIITRYLPERTDGLLLGPVRYQTFWEKVRAEVGARDLWVRDWRRTFASVALSNGISLSMIGELLNHHSASTTMRYAKLLPAVQAETAQKIADRISEMAGF